MRLLAGIACLAAIAVYGWTAIKIAPYGAPWSAPWKVAGQGVAWTVGNAVVRLSLLGVIAIAVSWPYLQGSPTVFGHEYGLGFFPPLPRQLGPVNLTWLWITLIAIALGALGYLFMQFRGSERRSLRPLDADMSLPIGPSDLAALTDAALLAMMAETDPRLAILACYLQMERGLANRGISRNPDETALEFARRLLQQADAPSEPVGSLTGLFHLAGFSTHTIDETMRQKAISSLRAIGQAAI